MVAELGGGDGGGKENDGGTRLQKMPYLIKRPLQEISKLLPSITPPDAFSLLCDNPKHLGLVLLQGSPLAKQYPAARHVARA